MNETNNDSDLDRSVIDGFKRVEGIVHLIKISTALKKDVITLFKRNEKIWFNVQGIEMPIEEVEFSAETDDAQETPAIEWTIDVRWEHGWIGDLKFLTGRFDTDNNLIAIHLYYLRKEQDTNGIEQDRHIRIPLPRPATIPAMNSALFHIELRR